MGVLWVILCLQVALPSAERGQMELWREPRAQAGRFKRSTAPFSLTPEREGPSSFIGQPDRTANCSDGPLLRVIMDKLGVTGRPTAHHCSAFGVNVFCHADDRCSVKAIRLRGQNLVGELPPELAGLQRLQALSLGSKPLLHGSFEVLRNLTQLQDISVMGGQVIGSLNSFMHMPKLRFLKLKNTPLAGELTALSNMTALKELFLDNTQVTGDLSALKGQRKMTKLHLQNTKVSGELEALQNMPWLTDLKLSDTQVAGKLQDLPGKLLTYVDMSRSRLTGNISSLAASEIVNLQLSGTQVFGDLEHLEATGRKLKKLDLSWCTNITGNIWSLLELNQLQEVSLAHTQVTGRLSEPWRGRLEFLHTLDLAGSRVQFLPGRNEDRDALFDIWPNTRMENSLDMQAAQQFGLHRPQRTLTFEHRLLLPALVRLDVSGCPLGGSVQDFLLPLAACSYLARIVASRCNLTGSLPDFAHMQNAKVQGGIKPDYRAPLSISLQYLDLSRNRISSVEGWTSASYVSLARNPTMRLAKGILRRALLDRINVDLTKVDIDIHEGEVEAQELLAEGKIKTKKRLTTMREDRGYACFDLKNCPLFVTPADFLPEVLCGCLPGWHGRDIRCAQCKEGTYNDHFNSTEECLPCPKGSTTVDPGATSLHSCICEVGRVVNNSGIPKCACEARTAFHQHKCTDCNELNLDCPEPGYVSESAPPKPGAARLEPHAPRAYRCLDLAEERCNISAANSSELGCGPGYDGPLCTTCAEGYRTSHSHCKRCAESAGSLRWSAIVGGLLALLAVSAAALAWLRRRPPAAAGEAEPQKVPTATDALWPLLLAQGSVLLQFLQLWGVLVALGGLPQSDLEEADEGLWEQEYVQWLQFTASGLRDALSLECVNGRMARTLCALGGPCVPLLLLKLCVFVELVAWGKGVNLALQVLSVFFIGGASSCAKLLHCQQLDGGGEPLHDHSFRASLPHLRCSETEGEARWADSIGYGCALSYAIFIPAILLYLIMKQHLILASSKRFVSSSASASGKTTLRVGDLQPPAEDAPTGKDAMRSRHLLSSAVAFCAVFFRGPVRLEMLDGTLTIEQVKDGQPDQNQVEFDADSIVSILLENKADADLQRWQRITRMLVERCVLEEIEASDRIMAGAKSSFYKYAAFREVWFEVATKLVAVSLVVVASSYQSLMMSLGFTLGTAFVLGSLKPYRQRQVNDLECFCFFCLSAAAAGFAWHQSALARGAMVAPFAVAAVQALRPDGPEALALRLFKVASDRWPEVRDGEAVELSVETVSFV